jgi:hypothetical protein
VRRQAKGFQRGADNRLESSKTVLGANLTMDDRLDFTEAAEDLLRANLRRELCRKVKALPEIRATVVNALRLAVASGMYSVRDEDIADAICREMKGDR